MASEDTLIGSDYKVQLGDGDSPPVYADICAVFDVAQIGEEKPLVDVTAYCDDARTYRNGLKDGSEIPMQMNNIPGDVGVAALFAAYQADTLVQIRVVRKTGSPESYFDFSATVRAWSASLVIGERSAITFTLKISGEVTWVV